MTTLRYRQAVLGFNIDLTSASALSVPFAALLVGKADGKWVASSIGVKIEDAIQLELDPISRSVLSQFPEFLKRHVDEAFSGLDDGASTGDLLHALHDCLRNSIHVVSISTESELSLDGDASDWPSQFLLRNLQALNGAVADVHSKLSNARPLGGVQMPEFQAWPLVKQARGLSMSLGRELCPQ